ncbi:MAG: dTMP kinase [Desulfuromonas sp.]|nr:MAG: dTMP kinase [Desulfuromonas sp.]
MGYFITFEGIEGCGKSTQIVRLAASLRQQGYTVRTTREPGGCPLADAMRRILLDPKSSELVPRAELLLYAAARAQHVAEVIRPALTADEIVLCDRYIDATVAYQGMGRGLDLALIHELNRLASDGVTPDLTLLLDMPVETGLDRARQRNGADNDAEGRFEAESFAFHQRIRDGYLQLAADEVRFCRIEAQGTIDEVEQRITAAVEDFLQAGQTP